MGFSIKIFPEDRLFSIYTRTRDKECVRCHSRVAFNSEGRPISHQASHYWGRRNWGVRHDPENVDTLCSGCHQIWGGDDRRQYETFKRKQLGERDYNLLEMRKNQYVKKDRKLALIIVKELLKTLP